MRYDRFLAVTLLAVILSLPGASAHSGDVLSAFGTATIDGVISAGEYGSCIGPVTVISETDPEHSYTITICETNDKTNDYYALQISGDTTPDSNDFFELWFDNTHDGTLTACTSGVEDVLFLTGSGTFMDEYYCYAPESNHDVTRGGSTDGTGAVTETSQPFVFEMSHPLSSGDSNDYSLTLGSTVGWCMAYLDDGTQVIQYPSLCMNGWEGTGSQALFGDIVKAPQIVSIDIKPGGYPNSINLHSKGVVPVAVLTTSSFDASTVDPNTVKFAGASPVHSALEDVNNDGYLDLILQFKTQGLQGLTMTSKTATLTGSTYSGIPIEGIDSVNIVEG